MKKKNNITELVFILDRSGSMAGLESDTIGGFNAMIEKQKQEEGIAYVSTILFNHESIVVHDRLLLSEVPKMTSSDYQVSGSTALLDTLGNAMNHISRIHKYARAEDVPAHTLFIITTDGMENASHRYHSNTIKKMIEEKKEKAGWEFLFIGANMDAVDTAQDLGISEDRAVSYCADSQGTQILYDTISTPISDLRGNRKISKGWGRRIAEDLLERKKE